MAKFSQNPELMELLIATDNALLVEGNKWNDRYWGVDVRTGVGRNHLGKILMKIRSEQNVTAIATDGRGKGIRITK